MPELGYAALDAISLRIPVAKITSDLYKEEIIDGFNGILARDDSELVEKIMEYITKYEKMKDYLCTNAIKTILRKRSIKFQQKIWKIVINGLFSH
jgi:glycosyltransferase involved in cell wall biosynthesis